MLADHVTAAAFFAFSWLFCLECFLLQTVSIFGGEEGLYDEFVVMRFRVYLSTITLCRIQRSVIIFLVRRNLLYLQKLFCNYE